MGPPDHLVDLFLQPGGIHFGDRRTRIRTILGSCVALVFWHPRMLVGGMGHFMLPSRGKPHPGAPLDGRYGDEALALLGQQIDAVGAPRCEYRVKVFGGGQMLSLARDATRIGCRNARAARALVTGNGFSITAEHLGGAGHRSVVFELWSGAVWMKHVGGPVAPLPDGPPPPRTGVRAKVGERGVVGAAL